MVFVNIFVILNKSHVDVKEIEDELLDEQEMAGFITVHVSLGTRGALQKRKTEIRLFVDEVTSETEMNPEAYRLKVVVKVDKLFAIKLDKIG